jgi:long-chain acyl-CoA synthetase
MYCMLLNAGTNAIIKAFSPDAVAQAIECFRVSHTLLVPTMIQMLVDHPAIAERDFSSLREIVYGASPISEALLDRAMARLPGVRFRQAYGMTELFAARDTALARGPRRRRPGQRAASLRRSRSGRA